MPNDLVRDIVFEVQRISKQLGVHPLEITKAQFLKETKNFTEWDVRKVGGLNSILKAYFHQTDKDLKSIQDTKKKNLWVAKLEREYGNRQVFEDRLTQGLTNVVSQMKIDAKPLDKSATKKYLKTLKDKEHHNSTEKKRSVCTIWSDQHFGINFGQEEMGGLNEYSWVVAARRLGFLCEQLATYKIEKRDLHEELVIFLIGDNISGSIHDTEGPQNDLIVHQIAGAYKYYIQAINYLKAFYPKIRIYCQPGNHGRFMHKISKDRAMSSKYDSFENIIFLALSGYYAKDDTVQFIIPKSPFCDATVQGHRIYATHGDTVFYTGNIGKSVPIQKLQTQVEAINANEYKQGKKGFELFATGHVHHPMFTHVGAGVKIVVNGCLVGTDPYAKSVGIHASEPVQVLWETTPNYVQGDTRSIYVNVADAHKKYEKIIQPYDYEIDLKI